ncbi:hypothetical protein V8F20_000281 [Naviculisporaceae sp. PSN 640]
MSNEDRALSRLPAEIVLQIGENLSVRDRLTAAAVFDMDTCIGHHFFCSASDVSRTGRSGQFRWVRALLEFIERDGHQQASSIDKAIYRKCIEWVCEQIEPRIINESQILSPFPVKNIMDLGQAPKTIFDISRDATAISSRSAAYRWALPISPPAIVPSRIPFTMATVYNGFTFRLFEFELGRRPQDAGRIFLEHVFHWGPLSLSVINNNSTFMEWAMLSGVDLSVLAAGVCDCHPYQVVSLDDRISKKESGGDGWNDEGPQFAPAGPSLRTTPLHLAVCQGRGLLLRKLLESAGRYGHRSAICSQLGLTGPCMTNYSGSEWQSVLHDIAFHGPEDCLRPTLESFSSFFTLEAHINKRALESVNGLTPLGLALLSGKSDDFMTTLIDHGASVQYDQEESTLDEVSLCIVHGLYTKALFLLRHEKITQRLGDRWLGLCQRAFLALCIKPIQGTLVGKLSAWRTQEEHRRKCRYDCWVHNRVCQKPPPPSPASFGQPLPMESLDSPEFAELFEFLLERCQLQTHIRWPQRQWWLQCILLRMGPLARRLDAASSFCLAGVYGNVPVMTRLVDLGTANPQQFMISEDFDPLLGIIEAGVWALGYTSNDDLASLQDTISVLMLIRKLYTSNGKTPFRYHGATVMPLFKTALIHGGYESCALISFLETHCTSMDSLTMGELCDLYVLFDDLRVSKRKIADRIFDLLLKGISSPTADWGEYQRCSERKDLYVLAKHLKKRNRRNDYHRFFFERLITPASGSLK